MIGCDVLENSINVCYCFVIDGVWGEMKFRFGSLVLMVGSWG